MSAADGSALMTGVIIWDCASILPTCARVSGVTERAVRFVVNLIMSAADGSALMTGVIIWDCASILPTCARVSGVTERAVRFVVNLIQLRQLYQQVFSSE